MTVTYNYLGYGVTDENGIAKLDHDAQGNQLSHSYTGTGAGEVDIVASLDSSITDSSLVSETYSLLDCKWYDMGTDNTNSMFATSSTMTVTYGEEYCTLTETTTGTNGVIVTDNNHYIQPDNYFEFDFLQADGPRNYSMIYIRNKSNGASLATIPHLYESGKELNTWIHYKCQIIDNKLYVYIDGSSTPIEKTLSNTDTDYRLYWTTSSTNTELRFKNFEVYPI